MARNKSAKEVEQEQLKAFGPKLGPLYHALEYEVIWLHAKWLQYQKLFAESRERVNLLNETAPFFFRVVHEVLWKDILLHIARLTDPPKQRQYENLTLRRLPDAIADKPLADEVGGLVDTARAHAQFAREWRNRNLAHRELSLSQPARPLPTASRQSVEDVLASFRETMNKLHVFYLHSEVGFEHFLSYDDADTLAYYLDVAVRCVKQEREGLRRGKPPEGINPPPEA